VYRFLGVLYEVMWGDKKVLDFSLPMIYILDWDLVF